MSFAHRLQLGSMYISSTSWDSTLETLQSPVVALPAVVELGLGGYDSPELPALVLGVEPEHALGLKYWMVSTMGDAVGESPGRPLGSV